jgi:uncharacterized protein with HEPN domain
MNPDMSDSKTDAEDYLRDILDNIGKVERFTAGMDLDAFLGDEKTAYAVIRALEIIGEAVKQLPEALRASYPDIAWRDIARMRDKLIHKYFGVNLGIVWKTITVSIPQLKPVVEAILLSLAPSSEESAAASRAES